MLAGVIGIAYGYVQADAGRREAVAAAEREAAERAKAETARADAQAKEAEAKAKEVEANAVAKFFEDHVFSAGRPRGEAGGLGHDVALRDAVIASLPALGTSFKDQPLVEARLRHTLGSTFYFLGDYTRAVHQGELARALLTRYRGPEHADTFRSMHTLASGYYALGRFDEALKLQEQTLSAFKRLLPLDDPDTLTAMHNLATSYYALGRHNDALKLREETLAARRRALPPDHPDTLLTMLNLANSHDALGRHGDALKLREETLSGFKRVLPPDHPDTLTAMHNLAINYAVLGRHAEAIRLYEQVLADRRRVLPLDHPDTLTTMSVLADSYEAVGRHAEALPLLDDVLGKANRAGVKPDVIAQATATRVGCLLNLGDLARARSAADALEKQNFTDALSLYNAACCRALIAAFQAKSPGPDAARLAREDADKAMILLTRTVAAGWRDANHLKNDTDLDALRNREDFKKLIAELEKESAAKPEKQP